MRDIVVYDVGGVGAGSFFINAGVKFLNIGFKDGFSEVCIT